MKQALLFTAIMALGLSSCKKENSTKTYHVAYKIGCTDCTVIYYKDTQQAQATEYHQNSSWTYSFDGRQGQEVLLFAYNTSNAAQGVTATIELNGTVLTTQTNYCPISGDAFVVDTIR